ncbi:hypothetical protein QNI16_34355 [Cytophagaceae bacterium YF14B1]|uniref:PH domain-containing protein n=1 Tax=Xanthocytophaga flava TaxID=3048013 RepID=A0AAE3U9Z3_9BACT|nr:hypothetical protein [Xanthocytophaga flavus]MDJ1485624.1 hypothetical protein [Xanthocytophaga flavus]
MKIYKLPLWKIFTVFIRVLLYSFLIGVSVSLFAIALFGDYYQENSRLIALAVIVLMSGFLIYRLGPIILLSFQYYFNEAGRKITLDQNNQQILIETADQTIRINKGNLLLIEYHTCHKIANTQTSDFDFVRFKLTDQSQWIITHLIVEQQEIRNLFPQTESVYKFADLNWLN